MAENKEIQKMMANNANVSIWLDSYDEIFSDFDSRPYHERSLSDDFIHEARKMAREKPDRKIELHLIMPANQRNIEIESAIIKSLHSYFRHISLTNAQDKQKTKKRGLYMTVIGLILMILAAYLSNKQDPTFLINTLRVVLEPACWFLVWTGFDLLYAVFYKINANSEFILRMSHSKINFQEY